MSVTNYIQTFIHIPVSRLAPYADEIIADHQFEFRGNRPNIDQILCIRQTVE
jgi:hypothetical protein